MSYVRGSNPFGEIDVIFVPVCHRVDGYVLKGSLSRAGDLGAVDEGDVG